MAKGIYKEIANEIYELYVMRENYPNEWPKGSSQEIFENKSKILPNDFLKITDIAEGILKKKKEVTTESPM